MFYEHKYTFKTNQGHNKFYHLIFTISKNTSILYFDVPKCYYFASAVINYFIQSFRYCTPTNKRKWLLRKWSLKFYFLSKINSVDKIIKIYYLIQTQGKFKKNRSSITVSFVHLNTNTPEFKIHKNRIPDTDSPTDKKWIIKFYSL